MRTSTAQWKSAILNIIERMDRELGSDAPLDVKARLRSFRIRLEQVPVGLSRKEFKEELEEFIQKNSSLRDAAQKYIDKILQSVLQQADETLKKADCFLRNHRRPPI